jgi:para-aminobenzoate synthetase component I
MLNWANRFNIFCLLDNQHYTAQPHSYECILGVGVKEEIVSDNINDLSGVLTDKKWYLGHLSYELKNDLHRVVSNKENKIGFPPFYFFVPEILIFITENEINIVSDEPEEIYQQIFLQNVSNKLSHSSITIQNKLSKEQYLNTVDQLRKHIQLGDCYEINFCQEFFAEGVTIDPVAVYQKLIDISPNPFSALYKWKDSWLMCASPERFLMKQGNRILSQPMKGTIKRDLINPENDEVLKQTLQTSTKDQSENVMVVDLVRNDLSRICKKSSVQVNELFGVYSFPQVHQMISTISGEVKNDVSFADIMKATFPMGSMTGAPKHRVMQLIDQYEPSGRGIFSGSVGYINPDGDFDFNVVIRSIMYNAATQYLCYQAGSGITFYSDPQKEWEECLLKSEAIKKVLTGEPAL